MSRLWVRGAEALDRGGRETLVVIGNFDGVHRGHQALLAEAERRSAAEGLLPVALTFAPHPAAVLGRSAPPVLTPLERKAALLRAHAPGVQVVVQPFDQEFAARTPEQFAAFLREQLGARGVVVGQNFRFGRGRAGDFSTLQGFGRGLGYQVDAIELRGDEGGTWSSTRVRGALARGDLGDANRVLGRPHELDGRVEHGQHRARTLGFPTANLGGVGQALPSNGVYAVQALRLDDGGNEQPLGGGVANIGLRPTVAAGFAIEAHLFEVDADLYGAHLRLELVARLRDERTFSGLDELKKQIIHDAEAARAALTMGARGA